MAEFSRFTELPKELQILIWEAAIPQSPSVHFLSYPNNRSTMSIYQWRSELTNANRTIKIETDPETGDRSMRARTWGRYSSYLANLALRQACRDSRRVCLAHTASRDRSTTVSTNDYTINLGTDIICIQDPDPRFPWNVPRHLSMSPLLYPVRIALERRPYLECEETEWRGNWITELNGGIDGDFEFGTSLHNEFLEPSLKVIYLLDYDIKPKYAVAAGASEKTHDGIKAQKESEAESNDCSAVKLPAQTSTHNGKFHGHGVTFYALSVDDKETCVGWVIPKESREFLYDVLYELTNCQHEFGYAVVNSLEQADEDENTICVEFLACIRA